MNVEVWTPPRFDGRRLSDWVVSEVSAGPPMLRQWVTSTTQSFMRDGMQEDAALVAAFTYHVAENAYYH